MKKTSELIFIESTSNICNKALIIWVIFEIKFIKLLLISFAIYPEWPHRQGGCLAWWSCKARSIPYWAETAPIYMHEALKGYFTWGWGCDQSIGSTVSDPIVHSLLWSTATRSSPLGYFSILLQVVDNWPHILCI